MNTYNSYEKNAIDSLNFWGYTANFHMLFYLHGIENVRFLWAKLSLAPSRRPYIFLQRIVVRFASDPWTS